MRGTKNDMPWLGRAQTEEDFGALIARVKEGIASYGAQLDKAQDVLDYASIGLDASIVGSSVSWIPDGINSSISLVRGDYLGAGLGVAAAVPAVGITGNLTRIGIRHAHHIIPKLLGGLDPQRLGRLTPEAHNAFHRMLSARLKARGISLPIGGRGGSTADWADYFSSHPGSQTDAFMAVLEASRLRKL